MAATSYKKGNYDQEVFETVATSSSSAVAVALELKTTPVMATKAWQMYRILHGEAIHEGPVKADTGCSCCHPKLRSGYSGFTFIDFPEVRKERHCLRSPNTSGNNGVIRDMLATCRTCLKDFGYGWYCDDDGRSGYYAYYTGVPHNTCSRCW